MTRRVGHGLLLGFKRSLLVLQIVGNDYGIADIAAWGWIDWAAFALPGADDPLTAYPNIRRWFDAVNARPAVARARLVGSGTNFRREFDDEAMRSLFPSNYPAE